MRRLKSICCLTVLGALLLAPAARAQTNDQNAPPPTAAAAPAPAAAPPAPAAAAPPPAAAAPSAPGAELLKPAELDGLVAPIALYPDTLLANVLMAATYPLEVVRAERWLQANSKLKGDALKAAAEKQSWDASLKALVAAPSVLQMMSERLDWTQKLGEAFLAQQQDVMDAVQRLRMKAYDRKKLSSTPQQIVTVRQEQNRRTVFIEPAVPDTLYVPYYEPPVVFGDWPYSDYPAYPYYWGYPGYIGAGIIATGIAFGAGYGLGRWARGGYWGGAGYWGGSRVNWGGGAINVNRGARVEHWQHNPAHRQGARYNNANLQQKFGNKASQLPAGGRQGLGDGANRQGLGQGANRQGLGQGANRANVSDRAQRADRGRQAAGNRQAVNRNRPSAARGARSGAGRVSARPVSPAGHFRPSAGVRSSGAGRFAGGGHRAAFRSGGGGGGFRGGGGGGFRGGGGGRRSDIALKHDIVLLGRLENGLGYYRFAYNGSEKAYVGVMAQEVSMVRPDAVSRGADGYLRVHYDRLGLQFRTYDAWALGGARMPRVRLN